MKPGVFQGKKFPFTPKRRKKSLGSQCNNIIDTRHDLGAFRSKLANVSWLRSYIQRLEFTQEQHGKRLEDLNAKIEQTDQKISRVNDNVENIAKMNAIRDMQAHRT